MVSRSLAFVVSLTLGSLSFACGDKGSGDGLETGGGAGTTASGGSGGSGGAGVGGSSGDGAGGAPAEEMVLYAFDSTVEGFKFEDYVPEDATYTNVGASSTLSWDDGTGPDELPGRLKLEMAFDAPNQLADIQLNMPAQDWTSKTLRVSVMVESGFSPDPSAPGGAYLFVKTGADYVWARGLDPNLLPAAFGTWVPLSIELSDPNVFNDNYDESQTVSIGVQFYTGMGGELGPPTATVAYVDQFTIQ